MNIGQNSTVSVSKGSLDQIEFLDTIPIILGINFLIDPIQFIK